jgi:hypothetical protein
MTPKVWFWLHPKSFQDVFVQPAEDPTWLGGSILLWRVLLLACYKPRCLPSFPMSLLIVITSDLHISSLA